jgi:hypothetical protein
MTRASRALFLSWMVVAACSWFPSAAVAYSLIGRSDVYRMTFDDLSTFSGALRHQEVLHTFRPSYANEVFSRNYSIPLAAPFNVSWVGDSHLSVATPTITSLGGSTLVSAQFRSLDGLPGSSLLSYDSYRSASIVDNQYVFRQVNVGGTTGDLVGSPFSVLIEIEGNWSAVGTMQGQHVLESINPLWTIDRNFEFDGTNTIFAAHIDAFYPDGNHRLDLTYSLHAAAVPEPEIYAMMGLGLGLLGWVGRRRKLTA